MPRKPPRCANCGSDATARVPELNTKPAVYNCCACLHYFTASGQKVNGPDPRLVRRVILRRWDQLANDLDRLASAIRDAPHASFTDQERRDMLVGLDQRVWDVMTNERPRLPASRYPATRPARSALLSSRRVPRG